MSLQEELAISGTKVGKAAGMDGICNELIKNGGYWMRASLCYLFNEVFDRHQVPRDWRNGLIVPLYKEGERDRATNYRGITLLSNVGKIFAGILERRLSRWCEQKKIFAQEQAGFRKGRTTTDQILTLAEIIRRRKNERKPTFCCFLDIKKAYDTVWRDGMWTKLTEAGVDGKMMLTIRSMYDSVKSSVVVNARLTA